MIVSKLKKMIFFIYFWIFLLTLNYAQGTDCPQVNACEAVRRCNNMIETDENEMRKRFYAKDFGGCVIDTAAKTTFWFENKSGNGNSQGCNGNTRIIVFENNITSSSSKNGKRNNFYFLCSHTSSTDSVATTVKATSKATTSAYSTTLNTLTTGKMFTIANIKQTTSTNAVFTQKTTNKQTSMETSKENMLSTTIQGEMLPYELVRDELNNLTGDASSVKQFEMQIIPALAKLDSGTIIESDTTTVVVQKLDVAALGYGFRRVANLAPENIQFPIPSQENISSSFVNIPLGKISEKIRVVNEETKRSERISQLTVVMANWKAKEELALSTNATLPLNSTVVSVSYYAQGERFPFPVSYEVDLENDFTEFVGSDPYEKYEYVNRTCSWLNISTGIWSQDGCQTVSQTSTKVRCDCNHTTTFAVLLSVSSVKLPEGIRTLGLVLEIISIVSLALTIIFLAVARHGAGIDSMSGPKALGMQANRTNSQLSLCISLLFFHFSVVWSDVARYYVAPCYSVTVFTHYFLLTSAFWSFNEGIGIFIKMAPNLTLNLQYRKLTTAHVIIGWVLPLILTITCLIYGVVVHSYIDISERYRILKEKSQNVEVSSTLVDVPRYRECWLSKKKGLVWTALVPVALVVLINFLILCYIARRVVLMKKTVATYKERDARSLRLHESIYKNSRRGKLLLRHEMDNLNRDSNIQKVKSPNLERRKEEIKHFLSGVRSFAILLPVLAIPWLLAILANIPGAEVPLSTAHVVINGLQGFEIFLLYCFIGKSDWQRVKRKWKNSGLSRMLSNHKPAKNIVSSAHTSHLATYNQTASTNPKNSNTNLRSTAFVNEKRVDNVPSDPCQITYSETTISSKTAENFESQGTRF